MSKTFKIDRTKHDHLSDGGPLILANTKERIASTNKAKERHRQLNKMFDDIRSPVINWKPAR